VFAIISIISVIAYISIDTYSYKRTKELKFIKSSIRELQIDSIGNNNYPRIILLGNKYIKTNIDGVVFEKILPENWTLYEEHNKYYIRFNQNGHPCSGYSLILNTTKERLRITIRPCTGKITVYTEEDKYENLQSY